MTFSRKLSKLFKNLKDFFHKVSSRFLHNKKSLKRALQDGHSNHQQQQQLQIEGKSVKQLNTETSNNGEENFVLAERIHEAVSELNQKNLRNLGQEFNPDDPSDLNNFLRRNHGYFKGHHRREVKIPKQDTEEFFDCPTWEEYKGQVKFLCGLGEEGSFCKIAVDCLPNSFIQRINQFDANFSTIEETILKADLLNPTIEDEGVAVQN